MSDHICKQVRYKGMWRSFCGKKGKHEHDGKWFCKLHHPPSVKAKDEKREERYKKQQADWEAAQKAKDELARRAAAYDRHTALLRQALEALDAMLGVFKMILPPQVGIDRSKNWPEIAAAHAAITALREALEKKA